MSGPFARQAARLSTCAQKYIEFMHNPFTVAEVPCVPTMPSLFARTVNITSKGVFSVGTTGFGFIAIDPINACHNDNVLVNGTSTGFVIFSTATYAGTTIVLPGATVASDGGNSDYLAANFGIAADLNTVRVVGAGLRIKYSGTELNRGGSVVAFHDPDHESVVNRSFADIRGEDLARQMGPNSNNDWMHITWGIADNVDVDFIPNNATLNALPNTVDQGCFPMGIVVESPPGAPGLFDYEVVVGLEISGRNVRGKRLSNADAVGFQAAQVTSMIPSLRGGMHPEQIASAATSIATMHVASQSSAYGPPTSTHARNWEDIIKKGVEGAIDILPDLISFL